jgi:hypothetical protein
MGIGSGELREGGGTSPRDQPHVSMISGWPLMIVLVGVGPTLYLGGLWAIAAADVQPLGRAACFNPASVAQFEPVRLVAAVTMALGAVGLLWAAPCLLGAMAFRRLERQGRHWLCQCRSSLRSRTLAEPVAPAAEH